MSFFTVKPVPSNNLRALLCKWSSTRRKAPVMPYSMPARSCIFTEHKAAYIYCIGAKRHSSEELHFHIKKTDLPATMSAQGNKADLNVHKGWTVLLILKLKRLETAVYTYKMDHKHLILNQSSNGENKSSQE